MKFIKQEKQKSFEPFVITLEVETEDEARILWHIFNRGEIRDAIFSGKYNANEDYILPGIRDIGTTAAGSPIREVISTKVKIHRRQEWK